MKLSLEQIARVVRAPGELSGEVSGYSIDSRSVQPGDLFFALKGENHDGHAFAVDVLERGAAAAIVHQHLGSDPRLIRVADTLSALQELAASAREAWGGKVVGITGSAGKTTTKDVVAAALESGIRTGRTIGNFNNHIGLPLSILRLPEDAEVAVLELGMNHAGEIRDLCRIARPDIGVVTNVGYAHIEAFESIDEIALAKQELIESLGPHGVAILNADDDRVRHMKGAHPGRTVLYGFAEDADVRAQEPGLHEDGVRFRCLGVQFESALQGRHSIRNMLAAIAVAREFNLDLEAVSQRMRGIVPGKMRGERFEHRGIKIINDSYNSNPEAVRGMLELLRDTPAERHVAVLGEMLELGRWSEPLHRDVGNYAARCGVTVLVGIRGGARFIIEGATDAGLAKNAAYFFEDPREAGMHLRSIAKQGDAILFKGSRGTRVEKALESFLE